MHARGNPTLNTGCGQACRTRAAHPPTTTHPPVPALRVPVHAAAPAPLPVGPAWQLPRRLHAPQPAAAAPAPPQWPARGRVGGENRRAQQTVQLISCKQSIRFASAAAAFEKHPEKRMTAWHPYSPAAASWTHPRLAAPGWPAAARSGPARSTQSFSSHGSLSCESSGCGGVAPSPALETLHALHLPCSAHNSAQPWQFSSAHSPTCASSYACPTLSISAM